MALPMTYSTITVLTYKDTSKNKRSVYDYETIDEAISRFHSIFGYMTTEGVTSVMAICYNSKGGVIRTEYWEKDEPPVEEPVEEPAEETPTEETTEEPTEAVSK
jgi:hypothetical protein